MKNSAFALVAMAVLGTNNAMAEGLLERIQADGKIVVATEAAFPPIEYVEDGVIVGFGSDLLVEVVSDLGVEVEQLDVPFQGILTGLAAGQYDLIATSVAINPERAQSYAFSRPIFSIRDVIVAPVDDQDIQEISDLNGLLVGTQLGSSTEAIARTIDEELKAAGGSGFDDLRLYQSFPETAFALRSGQVDALVIGSLTAGEFMTSSPDTFRVVTTYGETVHISWVTRPDSLDLLSAVNATITRLADSGELTAMQERWIGVVTESPADGYLPDGAVQ
ncbi:MAG: transporter substrate-binding domain-containing protein [Pseudomonadota bacterium]